MASWIVNIIMLLLGLVTFGVDSQDTLEHRIETVFGNTMANTSELFGPGYDVIVQPDPIIEVILIYPDYEMCVSSNHPPDFPMLCAST